MGEGVKKGRREGGKEGTGAWASRCLGWERHEGERAPNMLVLEGRWGKETAGRSVETDADLPRSC
jgi:hypothetical protein